MTQNDNKKRHSILKKKVYQISKYIQYSIVINFDERKSTFYNKISTQIKEDITTKWA